MQCEGSTCSKAIIPEISHSVVVVLQKLDKEQGYTFFQCEEGNVFRGMRWQHFTCDIECLKATLTDCINQHYQESFLHPIPTGQGSTRLHDMVLTNTSNTCAFCHSPLTSVAYRFCLTRAIPATEPLNDHTDFAGWCCSLDHARQHVLATVAEIGEPT